jgi:prolipoprotein diacylglyceryltransferase
MTALENVTGPITATASLDTSGIFWAVVIILMIVILTTVFFLFKNFRRFVYGLIIIIPITISYYISKNTVQSAKEGDYFGLQLLIGIIIGILIATGIGYLLQKTKFVKKMEEDWEDVKK